VTSGPAPLTVNFSATASDPDGQVIEHVWTFGDGTFSYNEAGGLNSPPYYLNQNPSKTFHVPGTYQAYLTVTDNDGNAVTQTVTVAVSGDFATALPTAVVPPAITPGGNRDESESAAQAAEVAAAAEKAAVLALSAIALSPTEVKLSWSVTGGDDAGYKIERSLDAGGAWTGLAKVRPGVTTYADTGLRPGVQYHYRVVTAGERGGAEFLSTVVSATTLAVPQATEAPLIEERIQSAATPTEPLVPLAGPAADAAPAPAPTPFGEAEPQALETISWLTFLFSIAGLGLGLGALWIAVRMQRR
jgi:PKD repeat protein